MRENMYLIHEDGMNMHDYVGYLYGTVTLLAY